MTIKPFIFLTFLILSTMSIRSGQHMLPSPKYIRSITFSNKSGS